MNDQTIEKSAETLSLNSEVSDEVPEEIGGRVRAGSFVTCGPFCYNPH
jgi:hypothetical protein